jgi:proton-coupled amino acid transporter
MAVTIYSMEGIGLILSLKASCQKPAQFPVLLIGTITVISIFMAVFGWAGYMAFGDTTQAPVTLNMSYHWSSTFVKSALCLGLYLTFPIMMFPSEYFDLDIFSVSISGIILSYSSLFENFI